jgi:PAS domain S-box-containing protein
MPHSRTPDSARAPLLARLKVGTKLMLLVLLPVCVLLGFTGLNAAGNWRAATGLRDYYAATQLSLAVTGVADQLADERAAAVLLRLRPSPQAAAALAAEQRRVNQALHQAENDAMGWTGAADVPGQLEAASRQLAALRLEVAAGLLSVQQIPQGYGTTVSSLVTTAGDLIAEPPTRDLGPPAGAYMAIVQAVEAAQRNRLVVATALGTPGHSQLSTAGGWVNVEGVELGAFRQNASQRLNADLETVLFTPAGLTVQQIRGEFLANAPHAAARNSLATWLDASGTRIDGLRSLESGAASELAATATQEWHAAVWNGIRDIGVSLMVLAVVSALALVLRRSITRPLGEVSAVARKLSGGDLAPDVSYAGRDEIGDVAAAFRDLHDTAGRLAAEIRAATAAIRNNQLDHRVGVEAFEGTWAQLLAGMNDTMAAFADQHSRRQQAERELEGIFNLSIDLLCIAGEDGYFKRVNPAFERTLGYSAEELLSRPVTDFVHPDDQARTSEVYDSAVRGEIPSFENRYIGRDGAVRWLQWNSRPVPEEGLVYAAARDVTDSRRAAEEQAALRRVATLVAKGAVPEDVFDAVVAETHMLLGADTTRLLRYEPDNTATVVAARGNPGLEVPAGSRDFLDGLGDAGAPVIVEGRLWGVMVAAWRQPQPRSGLEDRIAQFTELVATAIANAQARADLAASRARIVAASDQARRQIERDLHDGAQQRLVSLALGLRVAERAVPSGHAELKTALRGAADGLVEVLEELRELCCGIHPAILSTGGLGPALKALTQRSPVPVKLDIRVPGRLPERVEVAAYFVASEALANVAKYAHASLVQVRAEVRDGTLEVLVRDDGIGGADPSRGSGLTGLSDRVEALGGTIDVSSRVGTGTRVLAKLPASGHQPMGAGNSVTIVNVAFPADDVPSG